MNWMKLALGGVLAGLMLAPAAGAQEYVAEWEVTGLYTKIVASDCRNCEEDTGILFSCTGNGQPALLTVNAAASERGKDGEFAPVTFKIDGQAFTYRAKTVEYGLIGFTPEFRIASDDPLTAALQAGRQAIVTFNGARGEIGLKGSRSALDIFKAHCGWTPQGFQQNLQRAAAENPAQPQPPTGQSGRPFGVAAGEAFTEPNENGELWFTGKFEGDGGASRTLVYGKPETDAVALTATCNGTSGGAYRVALSIDGGTFLPDQPVDVVFEIDGQRIEKQGKSFNRSSESAGVELSLPSGDPLWDLMAGPGTVRFGVKGKDQLSLPGSGSAARFFVTQCRKQFG